MKQLSITIVSSAVLVLGLSIRPLSADTIASWTFENDYQTNSVTGTDLPGLLPAAGPNGSSAWGHHSSASTSYSDALGNGSVHALTADHWAAGDYFEFQTASLGFANLTVSFDQFRSNTGPTNWDFEYSTDGSAFSSVLSYSVTNSPTWTSSTYRPAFTFSVDLTSATVLVNNTAVYFRLVVDSPGAATGAARVDNFTISGMPVPEPSLTIPAGVAGLLVLLRRLFGCRRGQLRRMGMTT